VPLFLLALILGSPAFLIMLTTGKTIYVVWMLIYLCSLPIWNFVLPSYAFWHFDDFSWGETRKVEGVSSKADHGSGEGRFDASAVPLKTWMDYERRRRYKLFRESNQSNEEPSSLHRAFGSVYGSTTSLRSLGTVSEASSHLEIVGILDDNLEQQQVSENHPNYFSPSLCSDEDYRQTLHHQFSSSKLKKELDV
jgi:chitin synthase